MTNDYPYENTKLYQIIETGELVGELVPNVARPGCLYSYAKNLRTGNVCEHPTEFTKIFWREALKDVSIQLVSIYTLIGDPDARRNSVTK